MGETTNVCRILVREATGKLPVARPRRCGDNMKIDLREIRCGDGTYMDLAIVIVKLFVVVTDVR
jgi:hypothetical protein